MRTAILIGTVYCIYSTIARFAKQPSKGHISNMDTRLMFYLMLVVHVWIAIVDSNKGEFFSVFSNKRLTRSSQKLIYYDLPQNECLLKCMTNCYSVNWNLETRTCEVLLDAKDIGTNYLIDTHGWIYYQSNTKFVSFFLYYS